jgi:hypothetical protein
VPALWRLEKMYNDWTTQLETADKAFDAYMGMCVTAWFWPYFVMGNLDAWQKMGVTLNGIGPMCRPNQY